MGKMVFAVVVKVALLDTRRFGGVTQDNEKRNTSAV